MITFLSTTPRPKLVLAATMKRKQYRKEDLDAALEEISSGHLSLRKAASKYAIPATTLSGRRHGRKEKSDVNEANQRLTEAEETRLITWILRQEQAGQAPSYATTRSLAESLLKLKGDARPLGKHWIVGFKRRHPEVVSLRGRQKEAARFTAFTPKAVN